ncbi:MAG TPA: DUF3419 family protein [Polyangiaceae bacterium]|nr:DUF3419 family protein [Polyangiaceae bacterium]
MTSIRDRAFQRVFGQLLVYTILFEDAEVDERFLGIDEDSTILGISGAGCRIAGHLSQRPRSVDAVDLNTHHLALTALKVSAARCMRSYASFYELVGRGSHPKSRETIQELVAPLPSWIQSHWSKRTALLTKPIFERGLAARSFQLLRKLTGIDANWLRWLHGESIEARHRAIDEWIEPVVRKPWVTAALKSPLSLLALGVNYAQCERMLATEGGIDIVAMILAYLKRVAGTDLNKNWIAWHVVAGHYNHEEPDAVPPFIRRDRHERSLGSPTKTTFHRRNIFDVLGSAERNTWSHYTLCDAPDWMSDATQRRLFQEILRTSRDGAVMQYRTVERDSIIVRHGLEKHFRPLAETSRAATALDRSRLFSHVGFYQVVH